MVVTFAIIDAIGAFAETYFKAKKNIITWKIGLLMNLVVILYTWLRKLKGL